MIGGVVTLPVLGFTVLPPFIDQGHPDIDVGAIDDFPENKFVITTFLLDPEQGEVSRRTAYIRNNGLLGDAPSFTILSNRCVHLGCPVQVNGLPLDEQKETEINNGQRGRPDPDRGRRRLRLPVPRRPVRHRGQPHGRPAGARARPLRVPDQERTAAPSARRTPSPKVDGEGADAKIHSYPLAGPGQHVDGIEALLYPIQPPR